jgi:hypothetical protein
MLLQIPADLTILTLKDHKQTYTTRFTPQFAKQLLTNASALLESRANIKFSLGQCTADTAEVPPGTRADALDDTGFHFLSAKYRAGNGVRVLLVDKMARDEIGGRAREEKKITIVPYNSDPASTARKLAHEFCHLLGIEKHINEGASPEPGKEAEWANMSKNLMYSGSLNPEALLTPAQVATMRSSKLARQFGGTSLSDMFIPEILKSVRRM